jgi:hypothetical protein
MSRLTNRLDEDLEGIGIIASATITVATAIAGMIYIPFQKAIDGWDGNAPYSITCGLWKEGYRAAPLFASVYETASLPFYVGSMALKKIIDLY